MATKKKDPQTLLQDALRDKLSLAFCKVNTALPGSVNHAQLLAQARDLATSCEVLPSWFSLQHGLPDHMRFRYRVYVADALPEAGYMTAVGGLVVAKEYEGRRTYRPYGPLILTVHLQGKPLVWSADNDKLMQVLALELAKLQSWAMN